MKVDDKIVFIEGFTPAIIFPVGLPKDGGSCAFLTDHCFEYCPARETNEHEVRALGFFKKKGVSAIANKILEDLTSYNLSHLYWWPWGDCLPGLTRKITSVMLLLSYRGVVQNGFTRNLKLWKNINKESISENIRIGYHADTVEDAKDMSNNKVICCPDVAVHKAEMYFNGRKVARCCGVWCEWVGVGVRQADCQECYLYKHGCFYG